MIDPEKENEVIKVFKEKRTMTVQELSKLMGCSVPTIRKRLTRWRVYTSYNRNGRYYVMPGIPGFDKNGLWNYRGIRFSRFGTLKQTVIQHVKASENGLSASEIGLLVGLNPRSFMLQFRNIPEIKREKIEGKYIYFSSLNTEYLAQKEKREVAYRERLLQLPSDSEATLILVDIIRHPDTTIKDSVRRLRRKGMSVEEKTISNLLDFHKIALKKTPGMHS
ncbi:MAG TPA: hypothetical protein ENL43_03330 [candidate division WOR-3 bacterium]|uniref:Uncharacterized protein n=1 Tax=candidate division WOR-3 bacterium TaxID=2052148 RepID=A0A7V5HNJ6_UNCW3|nr:hypothetical protein [candidate division WOR-3 bacterium]